MAKRSLSVRVEAFVYRNRGQKKRRKIRAGGLHKQKPQAIRCGYRGNEERKKRKEKLQVLTKMKFNKCGKRGGAWVEF